MGTGKSAACGAVVVSSGSRRVIAVLGGQVSPNPPIITELSEMELFDCDISGTTPVCTKLANGPSLNTARGNFGCGVIEATDGSKLFLALKTGGATATKGTEVLDISDSTVTNWGSWQTRE